MDFLLLLGLGGLLCVLLGPIALAIANAANNRTRQLEHEVQRLRQDLQTLARAQNVQPEASATPAPETRHAAEPPQPATPVAPPEPIPARSTENALRAARSLLTEPPVTRKADGHRSFRPEIEKQFGGRAFVWLGGIALALAGFFLVKYSIETGLLNERVRVVLGLLLGLGLLGGSHVVHARPSIADGRRISQALAGAGIADLYGSLFAATSLYHILPAWLGFLLMAAVTLYALVLSLRQGAPIAALGLIGGYATPLMVAGEPNAPLLFAYLYLVFGGLSLLIRRQHWQWLAIPATLIAFAWVGFWLVAGFAVKDGAWLCLFLLGVSATAVITERGKPEAQPAPIWLRYLAPAGSLILMASVTYATHFGAFEWSMFGLLSAGAILLAWFDDKTYAPIPWLALAANLLMLAAWTEADADILGGAIFAFAALFIASSQYLLGRSHNPLSWGGLSAAAGLGYFALGYERLNTSWSASWGERSADIVWFAIAVAAAALFTWAVTRDVVLSCTEQMRGRLQATFAATATALLSAGFAILLHREYLPFAIAAEVAAMGWIGTRVAVPALRRIGMVLGAAYLLLLLPDYLTILGDLLGLSGNISQDSGWHRITDILIRLAVPALFFGIAAEQYRRRADDRFVSGLELASYLLMAASLFELVVTAFAPVRPADAMLLCAVGNAVLIAIAIIGVVASDLRKRPAFLWGACALAATVLARIGLFDFLVDNPLWSQQWVGATPVFDVLALSFAVPAAAAYFCANELISQGPAGNGLDRRGGRLPAGAGLCLFRGPARFRRRISRCGGHRQRRGLHLFRRLAHLRRGAAFCRRSSPRYRDAHRISGDAAAFGGKGVSLRRFGTHRAVARRVIPGSWRQPAGAQLVLFALRVRVRRASGLGRFRDHRLIRRRQRARLVLPSIGLCADPGRGHRGGIRQALDRQHDDPQRSGRIVEADDRQSSQAGIVRTACEDHSGDRRKQKPAQRRFLPGTAQHLREIGRVLEFRRAQERLAAGRETGQHGLADGVRQREARDGGDERAAHPGAHLLRIEQQRLRRLHRK